MARIVKTNAWSAAMKYLECGERDTEAEGADAEQAQRVALIEQHRGEEEVRRQEAQHEQHVAGDHVHGESGRVSVIGRMMKVDRNSSAAMIGTINNRDTGKHGRVLEEPESVLADARVDEGDVGRRSRP